MAQEKFDEIGPWSEIKLDIIREYAQAYSRILKANNFYHIYIDAFSGRGIHLSKTTGEFVLGSPSNALLVDPLFQEYHFIDLDRDKSHALRDLVADRSDAYVHDGDCNILLNDEIFPKARYEDYRRALCLLDPYGLHLDWNVILKAGKMRSIEIFLNFPIADMNRNVLLRNSENIDPRQSARLTRFWGDESWKTQAYDSSMNLFGFDEKVSNDKIAKAFQTRLRTIAGFKYVPEPMPMKNSIGATVYYLFFASQNPVAKNIVEDIFKKYRPLGA